MILKPYIAIDDLINVTTECSGISTWMIPSARVQAFLNRYNDIIDALTRTKLLTAIYAPHANIDERVVRRKYNASHLRAEARLIVPLLAT